MKWQLLLSIYLLQQSLKIDHIWKSQKFILKPEKVARNIHLREKNYLGFFLGCPWMKASICEVNKEN